MPSAIGLSGPRMAYGSVQAVSGLELDVRAGEVFALLGPNGAGKSTKYGNGLDWTDLGILAAWGLVGVAAAVRRFSWLPRAL